MNTRQQRTGQELQCRTITSLQEMDALLEYQKNCTSLEPLQVSVHKIFLINGENGGGTTGLYDSRDTLRGFAFHIPGRYRDRVVGWTYRFFIDAELRNRQTIQMLRNAQAELARDSKLERLYWAVEAENRLALSCALEPAGCVASSATPPFAQAVPMTGKSLLTVWRFDETSNTESIPSRRITEELTTDAELMQLCIRQFNAGNLLYSFDETSNRCTFLTDERSRY